MRIALIEPYVQHESLRSYADKPEPSHLLGMFNLLAENGVDVELIDAYCQRLPAAKLVEWLLDGRFTHAGMTGYDYQPCLAYLSEVVEALHDRVTTIIGGPAATYSLERLTKIVNPDWAVQNEGEYGLLDLVKTEFSPETENAHRVNGVNVLASSDIDLDLIPYQRPYSLESYGFEASPRVQKGCIGKCVFCIGAYQKHFAYLSPATTKETLRYLVEERGAKILSPCGPDLTTVPRKANDFVRVLVDQQLPITAFRPGVRLDTLHHAISFEPELWRALGQMTDISFEASIESFSSDRLTRLGKNVNESWPEEVFNQIEAVLEACDCKIVLGRIALDPTMTVDEFITDSDQFIRLLNDFPGRVTVGGALMNEFVPLWGTPAMANGANDNPWAHPDTMLDTSMTKLKNELLSNHKFRVWCQMAEQVSNFDERNLVFREILRVASEHARRIRKVAVRASSTGGSRNAVSVN